MLTLAELNYVPKAAAVAGGRGSQRARALPGHPSASIPKLSSENEEPRYASYSFPTVQRITATFQKHEEVNFQLV